MDETRDFLFQRKERRERGEHIDDAISLEAFMQEKARGVRLFYVALLMEGFSAQDALQILIQVCP